MDILEETEVEYVTESTNRTFLEIARSGLHMSDFQRLYTMAPFTISEWAYMLNVSDRSLQRYIKSGHRFSTPESEKLLRLAHLFNRGVSVFEEAERFFGWLKHPSPVFKGETPLSMLDSIFGLEMVLDEIGRIEHGILA